MKSRILFLLILISVLLTGCDGSFDPSPKKEVSVYSNYSLSPVSPGILHIEGDYGTIEIYSSNGKEIKYEAKSIIRGTGDKEKLKNRLKDFKIKQSVNGKTAGISFKYTGALKNPADTKVELRVYLPHETDDIQIKLGTGRIKLLDDMKCNVSLELGYVNTEINRMRGKLIMKAQMGDIRIGGGRLSSGTDINAGMGNIRIKSELSEGEHTLKTGLGNIELDLPEKTDISLKTSGNVKLNEFDDTGKSVKVNAESEIGEIVLRKTKEQL